MLRRQAGSGGLGSEDEDVLNRRRTISGPESLPADQPPLRQPPQQRPEPRPRSIVVTSATEATDGTATLRRKPRPLATEAPTNSATTVVTMTTGSETLRRRARANEQSENVQSNKQSESPSSQTGGSQKNVGERQQNGGVVLRRRPVSEASERTDVGRESCEWMEARKSLRPPVSPKPTTLKKTQLDPPTPTRRVPIPGPDNTDTEQSPGEIYAQIHTCSDSALCHKV